MRFEFSTATRIIFGRGTIREGLASLPGTRAFVVTGSQPDRGDILFKQLKSRQVEWRSHALSKEPTIDLAKQAIEEARLFQADMVIAMGGGSVIDLGKAVAAMLTNGGELLDYLEVIGRGKKITRRSAFCIAVPTTAGTGSEVTRNAVLGSPDHRLKVSMRSPLMLPQLAIIDPDLTLSMPPHVTASTGLDALTQCMEAFLSNAANPITDSLCREGLNRAQSLARAFHHGSDLDARSDMCLVSLFGGLALANAKLGAVHGFAGPLGGMFDAPHGVICASLLAPVMAVTLAAIRQRRYDGFFLDRFRETARLLTGKSDATADDGVFYIRNLCHELQIPPLGAIGLTADSIPDVVVKARSASSMKGHPITLTDVELTTILQNACE